MKHKIIVLSVICLFLLGVGVNVAQSFEYDSWDISSMDGEFEQSSESFFSNEKSRTLFDDELPTCPQGHILWGGADTPCPECGDKSTSGDAPVGNGFLVLLLLALGYVGFKSVQIRRKGIE